MLKPEFYQIIPLPSLFSEDIAELSGKWLSTSHAAGASL
jgi:hypothetical protein